MSWGGSLPRILSPIASPMGSRNASPPDQPVNQGAYAGGQMQKQVSRCKNQDTSYVKSFPPGDNGVLECGRGRARREWCSLRSLERIIVIPVCLIRNLSLRQQPWFLANRPPSQKDHAPRSVASCCAVGRWLFNYFSISYSPMGPTSRSPTDQQSWQVVVSPGSRY